MTRPPENRPPLAVAMQWVSLVTTIALEMAVPGVAGFWLDARWGTRPLFVILGVSVGFALGMWHLIKLAGTAK